MSRDEQCPVCLGELEVRQVQPCFVCGGWPGVESKTPLHHFIIRTDKIPLTLCNICWLEDILSDQGDLKERIKIKGERDLAAASDQPAPPSDKFCPACNCRLALLEIMSLRLSDDELERWRR